MIGKWLEQSPEIKVEGVRRDLWTLSLEEDIRQVGSIGGSGLL